MKKKILTIALSAGMIFAAPLSMAEKKMSQKKEVVPQKPVTGLITQVQQLMPFIRGIHEFGKIFLDLFGLKKMGQALDELIDASIAFTKETEREEGPRYEELEKQFAKMQAATEPLLEDLQKVLKITLRPLQWFSPMVTGPLKIAGRKTVKQTVYKVDPETQEKVATVVEIPIDKVVAELPEIITNKIFKLIQMYNNAIGNIMKAMQKTREKIKLGVEEGKEIIEKSEKFLEELKEETPTKIESLFEETTEKVKEKAKKRKLEQEPLELLSLPTEPEE